MRGPLRESTSCFLIRLSLLVLVPIGLFHRTQRPLLYDFIGLKVLCLCFHKSQTPLSFTFLDYHSLLYISKTLMSFVETITIFFTFPRLSESSLHSHCHTLISSRDYCLMACNLWLTASKYLAPFVEQYVKSWDAPEIKRKHGYTIREIP